jgi:hypothetical protein
VRQRFGRAAVGLGHLPYQLATALQVTGIG